MAKELISLNYVLDLTILAEISARYVLGQA